MSIRKKLASRQKKDCTKAPLKSKEPLQLRPDRLLEELPQKPLPLPVDKEEPSPKDTGDTMAQLELPEDNPLLPAATDTSDGDMTNVFLPDGGSIGTPTLEVPSSKREGGVITSDSALLEAIEGDSETGTSMPTLGSSVFDEMSDESPSGGDSVMPLNSVMLAELSLEDKPSPLEEAQPPSFDGGLLDLGALATEARTAVPQLVAAKSPEEVVSTHQVNTQKTGDITRLRLGYSIEYKYYDSTAKGFVLHDDQSNSSGEFALSPGESKTFENLDSREGPLTITIAHLDGYLKATVTGGMTKTAKAGGVLRTIGRFLADNAVAVTSMVVVTAAAIVGGTGGWLAEALKNYDVLALGAGASITDGLCVWHMIGKYRGNNDTNKPRGEQI